MSSCCWVGGHFYGGLSETVALVKPSPPLKEEDRVEVDVRGLGLLLVSEKSLQLLKPPTPATTPNATVGFSYCIQAVLLLLGRWAILWRIIGNCCTG
uniref:Uncharacterized protein n=1 Tax=Nelumbo nucifera TaxID=4432 RepID=A0A822ZPZ9_NELNU|nr:TPA_asm: hypothetical protein HUJ06_018001 [Nelumbo nucifera]